MSLGTPSQQDLFSSTPKTVSSDIAPFSDDLEKETEEVREVLLTEEPLSEDPYARPPERSEPRNLETRTYMSTADVDKDRLAPMLKQYVEVKEAHAGFLVLFQVGDFFEVFFEDAITVSDALSIRLTSRDKDQDAPIPMCGVPIHAFENYLPRLLKQGFSCVVVEQVEDPSVSKGLVKREITRIITPGVRFDGEGLDESRFNYLLAVMPDGVEGATCAFIEVSTGVLILRESKSLDDLENLLFRYAPREVLLPICDKQSGFSLKEPVVLLATQYAKSVGVKISYRRYPGILSLESESEKLFDGFRLDEGKREDIISIIKKASPSLSRSLAGVLEYVREISLRADLCISEFSYEVSTHDCVIDTATRRNLELSEASYDGDRKYSVLGVLDKTKTAAGGRLLFDWILSPLSNLDKINERHEAVSEILNNSSLIEEARRNLSEIRDIERLSTRISSLRATPYDFGVLRSSLAVAPVIRDMLSSMQSGLLREMFAGFDVLADVMSILDKAFLDDLPPKLGERDVIRDSFHPELERLRALRKNSQGLLNELELSERKKTGIQSLKVKHNSVFGYFIEISKGQVSKVPEEYTRKQTLTNAERFITPELKQLEQEIFSSKSRLQDLERQLFNELRIEISASVIRLQKLARKCAVIDVLFCFAYVAERNGYVKPIMSLESKSCIKGGRHPVVELVCGRPNFIPNDSELDLQGKRFAVLTGPNMGGKSTYLRQVGIIQILAQAGSFVPAKEAIIGIADRIFTRIGSGDALAKGESTFMVEMKEAANIIRNASERSIVLIDEIGRGTATADGLALATAISHWLIDKTRCRTIFATHFHELTTLPAYADSVFCLSVGIVETRSSIEFTHRIEEKVSTKSYGIHVAQLAGVPEALLKEARLLLDVPALVPDSGLTSTERLEIEPNIKDNDNSFLENPISPLSVEADDIVRVLSKIDPENISPLRALEIVYELSNKAKGALRLI